MATGYFVHGAFAGVKLPRHGLETAGAPPRHGTLSVIPVGALKGGCLAVVVATTTAAPRGSHDVAASAKREVMLTHLPASRFHSSRHVASCVLCLCAVLHLACLCVVPI